MTAKDLYISYSRNIIDANEEMAKDRYGISEMFTRSKLSKYKNKLGEYYTWLRECDDVYSASLAPSTNVNDARLQQSTLDVVEKARAMFIFSLNSYEKELSNVEGNMNFRLTTSIAILAIIISIVMGVI